MKDSNDSSGKNRRLLLTTAALLLIVIAADAGLILEVSLDKSENCTAIQSVSGAWLNERSSSGRLAMHSEEDGRNSATAILLRQKDLAGIISEKTTFPNDTYLSDKQSVQVTGAMYVRDASLPEVWLGGVEDRHYYEVRLNEQTWLLMLSAFETPPFNSCL